MRILGLTTLLIAGSVTMLAVGCGKAKNNDGVPVTKVEGKIDTGCGVAKTESNEESCAVIKEAIDKNCNVDDNKIRFEKISCNKSTDTADQNGSDNVAADLGKKASQAKAADLTKNASQSKAADLDKTASSSKSADLGKNASGSASAAIGSDASGSKAAATTTTTTVTTTTTLKVSDPSRVEKEQLYQYQLLTGGQEVELSIKANEDAGGDVTNVVATKAKISCADNLKKADEMEQDMTIVGDGKMIVAKSEIDKDGLPGVVISCVSSEKSKEDYSKEKVTRLKIGMQVSDKSLGYNISGKADEETLVSCNNTPTNGLMSGKNGFQLVEGTTVLWRNNAATAKTVSMISCEK